MTISGANYREGVAISPDGAVYVTAQAGAGGIATVLAQSFVAASAPADTTEDTLATITVPANTLGLNGALRIWTWWTMTSSVNNKTLRIRYSGAAGTVYAAPALTTSASLVGLTVIGNRGATNSQVGGPSTTIANSAAAIVTSAVDTTAATTIVITGQKASAGETLTLEGYIVEVVKP